VRRAARLLAAIVHAGGTGTAALAAPPAVVPSVFEERPGTPVPATPFARRVCDELTGKNAKVCQEAGRNNLYGTRKIGLDRNFVGR